MEDVVLVGRGKSVETFDWPDLPIAAVSSGVFVKQLPRRPDHWITVDCPRFYVPSHKRWAYHDDPNVQWWDVCGSSIPKHVTDKDRRVDPIFDLIRGAKGDTTPDGTVPNPSWDIFANVTRWTFLKNEPINFDQDTLGAGGMPNSTTFAVQVLYRLGFKRVLFAGIDIAGDGYRDLRELMNQSRERSPLAWPALEG